MYPVLRDYFGIFLVRLKESVRNIILRRRTFDTDSNTGVTQNECNETRACVCMHACIYVCMYVLYVCTYVCVYVCTFVCVYVLMYFICSLFNDAFSNLYYIQSEIERLKNKGYESMWK
jgi:cytochrome b561